MHQLREAELLRAPAGCHGVAALRESLPLEVEDVWFDAVGDDEPDEQRYSKGTTNRGK